MKRTVLTLMVLSLALPLLAAGPNKEKFLKAKNKIVDQYIVVLEDGVESVDAVADDLVVKHRGHKDRVFKNALKGFSATLSEKEALALANDPRVAYVEEDGVISINATQTGATWGLDRVDQRDLPLNTTYVYNATGAGVKAYIIDTGINVAHVDFGGRAINGFDAVDGALPAADCNGHGTHVAGTVGGATWGVAKGVTLVAVRVLDCGGSGTNAGVIAGIDWVTGDHAAGAPAVANMSLLGGASTALDAAVRSSITDGVTYALASGNFNANACNYSPSRVLEGITVNNSTTTDARASSSNWGTCTDIFAPGTSITSAWYTSNTATNTISGTSMATPHVAGAAALYLQGNPSASPASVANALISNATLNKITSPGTGSPNRLLYTGFIGGGTSCPEGTCIPAQGTYVSHYSTPDCGGTESYYLPYDGFAYQCRSWNGSGACGTIQRTVTNYSARINGGPCQNLWPSGNTLSQFVTIYRTGGCGEASCVASQGMYVSHFSGPACSGNEWYYLPYDGYAYNCRTWNGTGQCGTSRQTVTNYSARINGGACQDLWPGGNTLSDFVRIYR